MKAYWRPASMPITEQQMQDPDYMPLKQPKEVPPTADENVDEFTVGEEEN